MALTFHLAVMLFGYYRYVIGPTFYRILVGSQSSYSAKRILYSQFVSPARSSLRHQL